MSFKHSQHMPWILPGIPPTNKQVEVTIISIVCIRGGKLYSEHVYWDQASVLLQVGLLDPKLVPEKLRGQGVHRLPVVGREAAMRILEGEDGKRMNELVPGWGSRFSGKEEEGKQAEEETEPEEETAEADEEDEQNEDDEESTQSEDKSAEVEEDTDEADRTEEAEITSDEERPRSTETEPSQQGQKAPQTKNMYKGEIDEAEDERETGARKSDEKAEVKEEASDKAET